MLFCPLPAQVGHLKWWLTKFFAVHLDIFYIYSEMGNDELTEMQLTFQDLPNPLVLVTMPKVGGTGLDLTAAKHSVITQKFWVLNEQWLALALEVRLGQN
jgi:SNF2 family DNA or RNA helicase